MEDNVVVLEEIITKWDINGSSFTRITSLFCDNRDDARLFLQAVADLQHAMHFFISHKITSPAISRMLSHYKRLMATAMARLQKEFYLLLAANYDRLDSGSLSSTRSSHSDEEEKGNSTSVIDDLRTIARCMMDCGYTKECVKVYVTVRRSVVGNELLKLGYVRQDSSQVQKLHWEAAGKQIRIWVAASRPAIRMVFAGERFLCEYVFGSSKMDLIFAEVAKEHALGFLRFPELVATGKKCSLEKTFHYLDLYDSISDLCAEIRSLFSHESTRAVPSQAEASLVKVGKFVRQSLAGFESAIQTDCTKTAIPGGDVHPLTRYVMNYLCFLGDYTASLGEILGDQPFHPPKPLPEPFVELLSPVSSAPSSPRSCREAEEVPVWSPAVSSRVAWLILLLLGKVDKKAEVYGEAALSYLFLANNLRYVVNKVRTSNLRHLLGEEWVRTHGERLRSFTSGFQRLGWKRVLEAIPGDPEEMVRRGGLEAAEEAMEEFSEAFEEACMKQRRWVVRDKWMREDLKLSIAGKLMVPYRKLYKSYVELLGRADGGVARFTPGEIAKYLSDLFHEQSPASPSGSSRSSGSGSGSGSSHGLSKAGRWWSS